MLIRWAFCYTEKWIFYIAVFAGIQCIFVLVLNVVALMIFGAIKVGIVLGRYILPEADFKYKIHCGFRVMCMTELPNADTNRSQRNIYVRYIYSGLCYFNPIFLSYRILFYRGHLGDTKTKQVVKENNYLQENVMILILNYPGVILKRK